MKVRLFVAVEITEETRKKLTAFQEMLKKAGADVGWVAPENLHITLKFIGYIDEEKTEEVLNIIKDSVTHIKPFNLSYAGVGVEHEARKFDAHLTVGRVKTRRNVTKLMESLNSYNGFNFGLEHITQVVLMKSTLSPEGPIYTKLHSVDLVLQTL